jgi:hypothetical protein
MDAVVASRVGFCPRATDRTTFSPSSSVVVCGFAIIGNRCDQQRTTRTKMSITFPNPSRSYDAGARAVRFWGYDSAMEASFFVSLAALQSIEPRMTDDEVSILTAFDDHRDRICATAARVYMRGHKGSYDLNRADF